MSSQNAPKTTSKTALVTPQGERQVGGEFTVNDFISGLNSLFGSQSRQDSQNFSMAPAVQNQIAANTAATQSGLSSLGLQKEAASFGSGLSAQAYQQRKNADLSFLNETQKLQNQQRGGGAVIQGPGAFSGQDYKTNFYGQSFFDPQSAGQWRDQRTQALQSTAMFGRVNTEIERQRAQNLASIQLKQSIAQGENDRYNQQLASAQNFQQQAKLQGTQLATQKAIAQTQAQSNILSSLFGSVGAGSPNYRYWS
jgi:hypothetical protein